MLVSRVQMYTRKFIYDSTIAGNTKTMKTSDLRYQKGENMMKNKKWIGASLLVIALIAAGIVSAFTLADETTQRPRKDSAGCLDQLTEEQREALDQMIQELKDAGATHEEIQEAVQQYLEEQGINMEDCRGTMEGFGHRGPMGGCSDQLTEEQREALDQMIQEMKDAGATHEEIQEAVQQYLEEQGISIDADSFGMEGFGHKGPMGGCLDQLTEEQREALDQMIQEMKDAGATPEEIQEAVQQYLEELGIDTEQCGGMRGPGQRTQSEGGP